MRGSLLPAVFMPCLHNGRPMGLDDSANHIQLSSSEAVITGKPKRPQPKLTGLLFALHVNVRWLIAVEAREEEPMRPGNTFDPWHSEAPPPRPARRTLAYHEHERSPQVSCAEAGRCSPSA